MTKNSNTQAICLCPLEGIISELAFLLDVLTKSIELTREESKKLRTRSLQRQS